MSRNLAPPIRAIITLAIAIVARVSYLYVPGFAGDIGGIISLWGKSIYQHGLFSVYANEPSANYPPISTVAAGFSTWAQAQFGYGADYTRASELFFKIPPLLAELAMILAVALFLCRSTRWNQAWVCLLLALHPGLIATTAFWVRWTPCTPSFSS
jgi:hypothetical protein